MKKIEPKKDFQRPEAFMPLWINDHLTEAGHLTDEQYHVYRLLLTAYWRNFSPLNDEDKYLASIAMVSPKKWKKLRPVLLQFFSSESGLLILRHDPEEHNTAH